MCAPPALQRDQLHEDQRPDEAQEAGEAGGRVAKGVIHGPKDTRGGEPAGLGGACFCDSEPGEEAVPVRCSGKRHAETSVLFGFLGPGQPLRGFRDNGKLLFGRAARAAGKVGASQNLCTGMMPDRAIVPSGQAARASGEKFNTG